MQFFLKSAGAISVIGILGYLTFTLSISDKVSNNSSYEESDTGQGLSTKNESIGSSHKLIEDNHTHQGNNEHPHAAEEGALNQDSYNNNHHNIPNDIKKKLCVNDNSTANCTVDTDIDYISQLTTDDGKLLADKIGIILNSNNFQEVLNDLSTKKLSNESYEREFKYNDELTRIVSNSDINSEGIYCGNSSCGMVISSNEMVNIDRFNKEFFADLEKGNLFIVQIPVAAGQAITQRIMFFPNNLKAINKRIGN